MTQLLSSEKPLSETYDAGLVDLDGTMYRGSLAIDHAAEGVNDARDHGLRIIYVTNNASRPPQTIADQLDAMGTPTEEGDVYTSAMAAARLAVERHGPTARVFALGGAGLTWAIEQTDLQIVEWDEHPDAVIQGINTELGWKELTLAARAIAAGAEHLATNTDATFPQENGFALGNGALVAAVAYATGIAPLSAGKPEKEILRFSAEYVNGARPLVVGDRLDTDIAGGVAAGMPTLHVLTGVSSARDVVLADEHERPSFLGIDMRDLNEPHPVVGYDGVQATCRNATARIDSNGLPIINGQPMEDTLHLDEYRALAVAAWHSTDVEVPEFKVIQ